MKCVCGKTFVLRIPGSLQKYCTVKCKRDTYRAAHMGVWRSRAAAFRAAHPEKTKTYNAQYRSARRAVDPMWHKRYDDARYAADPDGQRARAAAYKAANAEKVSVTQRAWYLANAEAQRARVTEWRRANPEQMRHQLAVRRGHKAGNGGSHTLTEWREICATYKHLCAYCSQAKSLTRDHDVPLSRGGTDDIDNIVPACRSCNSKKLTKTATEFRSLL